MTFSNTKGQTLIELILTVGISTILLPALILGLISSREGKAQQNQRIDAVTLLKEAQEAVRSVRETSWSTFAINGTYHPISSGATWILASGSESINGLTRSITIQDAYRDSSGQITTNGGTVDPSTKHVALSVSWLLPFPTSVTSELYLTRHLNNASFTQTTVDDFNSGTRTSTYITDDSGGEIVLGAGGGGGDWCNPALSITTVDLSRQGVPTNISSYLGNIVTGTGGNASGPTFIKVSTSNNNPPVATISGQFNNSKALGIFTETNYGYIATSNHSEEIQILDLTQYSDPPTNSIYKKVGYFNAPGNEEGGSIFVSNNIGYMTAENEFYTFDLSSRIGAKPRLNTNTVSLAGSGKKIVVVGNYAYVATNSITTQMQIIDVSDPVNPSIVANVNLNNSKSGVDVAVNSTGTRAYVVTGYSASKPDFFIIDTSIKSGTLSPIGAGFSTNVMEPKGVAIATGNRAIIVGTGGTKQYQVVNIVNELTPVVCGNGLSVTGGIYGISSVLQSDGYAYSYIVTGDTNAELKIILGGAGGQHSQSGTFESSIFDASQSAAFNRISATINKPSQTDLLLQVAVASAANNSCNNANFTYIGPDGTSGSYFTGTSSISSAIPLITIGNYSNPGRCFRYKAFLSTADIMQTPVLYDVSVNYSL